eukprot:gene32039-13718_t
MRAAIATCTTFAVACTAERGCGAHVPPRTGGERLVNEVLAHVPFPRAPTFDTAAVAVKGKGSKYPSVTAHGMGDSCFNAGMKRPPQCDAV